MTVGVGLHGSGEEEVVGVELDVQFHVGLYTGVGRGMAFDCKTCGACCVTMHPGHDGGWIPIEAQDMRRLSPFYQRRKVICLPWGGNARLKTEPYKDGVRCAAFSGKLGGPCRCTIYRRRPTKGRPCSALAVELGSL